MPSSYSTFNIMKIFKEFHLIVFQICLLLYASCFSILQTRRNRPICNDLERKQKCFLRRTELQSSIRTEDNNSNSTIAEFKSPLSEIDNQVDNVIYQVDGENNSDDINGASASIYTDVKNIFGGLHVFEGLHEGLMEDISDLDIEYAGEESLLDISIAKAVKQMLDEGSKEPEPSPVEKFQNIYKDIKSKNTSAPLDSASMLKMLFEGGEEKDPFDERKVMIKLRNMLAPEDFKDLFLDPTVGEW